MHNSRYNIRNNKNILFIICFIASLLIGMCFRAILLEYVHIPERAMWRAKSEMIGNYKYVNGDIIIIGSSKAMSINPEHLQGKYNINAVNYSLGGATTPSTYFLLKRILKNNLRISKVYLEFAPMNITKKDTGLEAALGEFFLRYTATSEEAKELDTDLPGALEKYNVIHKFPYPKYVNMKDTSLLEGVIVRWRTGKSDQLLMSQLTKNKGYFLYPSKYSYTTEGEKIIFDKLSHDGYQKLKEYSKVLPPVTGIYLNKIIELLRERNIDCVIFFSPISDTAVKYPRSSSDGVYALFKANKSVVNDHILLLERQYFSDPSHVNKKGSELYTDFFYSCIINRQCGQYTTFSFLGTE